MVYNRQYNNRNSQGRYNTPGQFVSAAGPPLPPPPQFPPQFPPQQTFHPPHPQPPFPHRTNQGFPKNSPHMLQNVMKMVNEDEMEFNDESAGRPPWMKSKLPGVRKITKKERRRRQNENLRRLITPKNALMVLNEMLLNEQITNQNFKVEPVAEPSQYFKSQNKNCFCAELTLEGMTYKGYGENKMAARNAAAEQAVRDLIIQRMHCDAAAADADMGNGEQSPPNSHALPMIQLASFALHKLFAEWECGGHKVPSLRPVPPGPGPVSEPELIVKAKPPKKPKELPANARHMHPCMVLTHMRPQLAYRELNEPSAGTGAATAGPGAVPGAPVGPFTVGVDVDGATYIGTASSKKEARKEAARAACLALFDLQFEPSPPVAAVPAPAPEPTPMFTPDGST